MVAIGDEEILFETDDLEEEKKDSDQAESEALEESEIDETSQFLYLVDLVSALNQISIQSRVVEKLLDDENLPEATKRLFGLFRERDQFRELLSLLNEKLEYLKAAAEGALMAAATFEFTKRVAEKRIHDEDSE